MIAPTDSEWVRGKIEGFGGRSVITPMPAIKKHPTC